MAKATEHKGRISYYTCDITDAEGVHSFFEIATRSLRYPLRGLVCCAGVSGESPAVDYPIESFRRIVDINLCGTFSCAQAAARVFCRQKIGGSVVLIASTSGHVSNKVSSLPSDQPTKMALNCVLQGVDTAAYNSSKAAVLQLGRSLAAEWGSRPGYPLIRVNTLSPGYIRTQMTLGALQHPNREAEWSADNMMNRLSFADEYRGPIMYLLGDASSFMTGADLVVDGGHTAW